MAQNSKKEYVVNFRGSNNGTGYTYNSKTIKADSQSAALKIAKGLYKFVQIISSRQK